MEFFFKPKSIAVIGASKDGMGGQIVKNLKRGGGMEIHPVNPKYPEMFGLACYPSVEDIPGDVDLVVALVPAAIMPGILTSCGKKGVKGVMIEGAGFAETGDEGRALQEECVNIGRKYGMRLWGPNCMGMVDVTNRRFFSFMNETDYIEASSGGRTSLIVQSGMLSAGFLADLIQRRFMGVGKVCSIGNKCDVDECDVLEYLLADPDTDAIGLYLEAISRGGRFIGMIKSSAKPIVVLKTGQSISGAKAALSHTASLAGDAQLTSSLLHAAGALQAEDFQEMFEMTNTLAMLPHTQSGCRLAVVTFSGGAGILSCDLLEKNGLGIAELAPETIERLRELYPPWMPPDNPMDLFPAMMHSGFMEARLGAIDAALADPGVDGILMHMFAGMNGDQLDLSGIKKKVDDAGKIVAIWCFGLPDRFREIRIEGHRLGIPVFEELSRAARCLSEAGRFNPGSGGEYLPRTETPPAVGAGKPVYITLDEYKSKLLLAKAGVPVVEEHIGRTKEQALLIAEKIGFPLVVKGLMPDVVHKTELGLVYMDVNDENKLWSAVEDLQAKFNGEGDFLLQRQVKADYELIAGFLRDRQFGPCVMLGMGGKLAELRPDVTFSAAPLSVEEAESMLDRLESRKLFEGFRGMTPLDRKRIAGLIVNLANMGVSNQDIEQVDINPVIISDGRPAAVDATIIKRKL